MRKRATKRSTEIQVNKQITYSMTDPVYIHSVIGGYISICYLGLNLKRGMRTSAKAVKSTCSMCRFKWSSEI